MVMVSDNICGVATWDFYEYERNSCSIYEEHLRDISAFSILLGKLKENELFIPNKIITSDWGYDLEEPVNNFIKLSKDNEKFIGEMITHPPKTFLLSDNEICDERFWWNIFLEWSGKEKVVNLYFKVFGKTLLYVDHKPHWVDSAFTLGYLSVTTFVTDWMPYLLDGKTPNPDYENNFFRLRDAFASFMEETGYMIMSESTQFAMVEGIEVLNIMSVDGERIGLDINGNFLD